MAEEVPRSLPTTTQEEPQTLPPQPEAPAPTPAPAEPPPLPAAAAPPEPKTKKRKLEDAGFHNSAYFKIRTIVKDLRPLFLVMIASRTHLGRKIMSNQLVQASDFRNSNAAHDILKQISTLTELSKQLRNELTTVEELKKPSEESKPLPGAVKKEPTNNFQEVNAPNANVIQRASQKEPRPAKQRTPQSSLKMGSSNYYVVIQCGNHTFTSKITSVFIENAVTVDAEKDRKVCWNEKFRFMLSSAECKDLAKLKLRIMEKDKFLEDRPVGETMVYLRGILREGREKGFLELKPPSSYNVVLYNGTYEGELKIGLKFISNVELEQQTKSIACTVPQKQPYSLYQAILSINLRGIPWSRFFFFHNRSESRKDR
uniref:C2 domain-containing protein n=1 Tax=Ananas comosus var. bracteatus TaxID=296719 RepID=A0A6V7QQ11_ANACO|nr:unnamed protein product [Ananas comosus var. bracteatus]